MVLGGRSRGGWGVGISPRVPKLLETALHGPVNDNLRVECGPGAVQCPGLLYEVHVPKSVKSGITALEFVFTMESYL